jgi:hypothetical protein
VAPRGKPETARRVVPLCDGTREILPAASLQELEECKARTPLLDEEQAICQLPSKKINPSLRYR